jgi:DNA (cytosine-5)-methyltransferase 3A
VLSLFDGLGGARIALDQLGIECNYYASEVDKYAMKVAKANYPDIIHIGDVCGVSAANLPRIDLLIGGSPCQDLSVAKSGRKGLDGERSGLFWEYVRLLKECEPKYFLLENVYSMPKESRDIISKALGCSPIMINSALLTAQNRKRYYWTNTGVFMQPMDRGIVLADIIECGEVDRDKSYCLTATYKMDGLKYYKNKKQRQIVFKGCAKRTREGIKELELREDNKSNALTTVRTDSMVGIYTVPRGYNKGGVRIADKAPAVTSNSYEHNNLLVTNTIKLGYLGQDKRQDRVYSTDGKSVTLCGNGGGQGAKTGLYYTHEGIRKLTPLECERLQGIPDGYTNHVSNTQRYKMIGNGFTIPVIKHLLEPLQGGVTDEETEHTRC